MKEKNIRRSGILMPISALDSPYGIGTLGEAAYRFADFLKSAGCTLWQVLPVGPTGYGDSPYQSFSAFAGNPYFIDLDLLVADGLLLKEELETLKNPKQIDYKDIYDTRFSVLEKAYSRFDKTEDDFVEFKKRESVWLDDYSLYSALKRHFGGVDQRKFPKSVRTKAGLAAYASQLENDRDFERFMQYKFFTQWQALRRYCNENGILIIGDIPIYTALDSADVMFSPELFELDKNGEPTAVAGCPPDAFSDDGQLWGNPLYNYDHHRKTGYDWWIRRIRISLQLYDMVRIDHFRGFSEYYAIPADEKTARNGEWRKGPGYDLFKALEKKLGRLPIIAEDLGQIDKKVRRLLKKTGFPGMKVLQFAFGGGRDDNRNKYLPHEYGKNCIVYTGTHDNAATRSWFKSLPQKEREYVCDYLGATDDDVVWKMITAAFASAARYAVVPMADILGQARSGRINLPGTLGKNWTYRITKTALSAKNADKLRRLNELYGRTQRRDGERK